MENVYHYPPELFDLMVECIPRLNRSKRGLIDFFRGAGVQESILSELWNIFNATNPTKFEMTRFVLNKLNGINNDNYLRQRREVLKRVYEFESFEQCWDNDRLAAKGLVSEIQKVVGKKDAFTRMNIERTNERRDRLSENQRKAEQLRKTREEKEKVKLSLFALFYVENPQERGKQLESVLNQMFSVSGILIRDSFTVRGNDGQGVIEQIDGAIELDGEIYLVEMKWLKESMGKADMSEQLMRLFTRNEARGIVISASGFSKAALEAAREALGFKVVILIDLQEIVMLLERERDLKELLITKVQRAVIDKNPYYNGVTTE